MADSNTSKRKPSTFLIALFPGFQLMDLAGPLDIFNILSFPPFSADISMKFIAESLDPVPTKPEHTEPAIPTAFNQCFQPDLTFSQYLASPPAAGTDVLIIPGGIGTRMTRTSSSGGEGPSNVQALLDFIPRVVPHLNVGIMTVCTGSDALARTGLLNGRRATTNLMRFADVKARNTGVDWIWGARWVLSPPPPAPTNGGTGLGPEVWSSAGISAGMDVALAFVAAYFGGMDTAREVARRLEYDWREVGDGVVDQLYLRFYGGENK